MANKKWICKSSGKRQYASRARAELDAKILGALKNRGNLGVYSCPQCKCFHLRNNDKRKAKRRGF